jgi:hypothetical protein
MRIRIVLLAALAALPALSAAYDANGVRLGASEEEVRRQFPSAHCKPLEWSSLAADRRCDDARISFGGVQARVTFYLRKGVVEAFDVRFDTGEAERLAAHLKKRYGAPAAETRERIEREGRAPRDIYKVRWQKGPQQAVMTSQAGRKRSSLTVSRGNFEEEIYRVR